MTDQADPVDWDSLNHSELVLLVQWLGLPASRAVPREVLLQSVQELAPVDFVNPIDDMRQTMSRWLKLRWAKVRMQASKSVCPDCFACRDLQALVCHELNKRKFT